MGNWVYRLTGLVSARGDFGYCIQIQFPSKLQCQLKPENVTAKDHLVYS